ncbi:MAG: IclR family transcriptional regulator [Chloroflexota bacterium]
MSDLVQSIERAFQILNVVHGRANGITVGELAKETALHTSTTSRIVNTLEHVGAITRCESKLMIGEGIVRLANRAPWTEQIISLATPCLRELANITQEAVGLTTVEGDECIVFYQIPSDHHIQIRDWTGNHFPLHVTSTGKLYLAELDEVKLERQFQTPLHPVASATKTDEAELMAELAQIRQEGVAWTIDELEDGLTSIGATIQSVNAERFVAIYLSMPSFRFNKVIDRAKLTQQMLDTAVAIRAMVSG